MNSVVQRCAAGDSRYRDASVLVARTLRPRDGSGTLSERCRTSEPVRSSRTWKIASSHRISVLSAHSRRAPHSLIVHARLYPGTATTSGGAMTLFLSRAAPSCNLPHTPAKRGTDGPKCSTAVRRFYGRERIAATAMLRLSERPETNGIVCTLAGVSAVVVLRREISTGRPG